MRFPARLSLSLAAIVLALGALVSVPARAHAWEGWCEDDPGIVVNGQVLILAVAVPQQNLASVDGTAQFVVTVPAGVSASLGENDAAWFPDSITIVMSDQHWNGKDAVPVDVSVVVPGSQSLPVRFLIKKPNLALTDVVTGASNEPISRHVELPASLFNGAGKGS